MKTSRFKEQLQKSAKMIHRSLQQSLMQGIQSFYPIFELLVIQIKNFFEETRLSIEDMEIRNASTQKDIEERHKKFTDLMRGRFKEMDNRLEAQVSKQEESLIQNLFKVKEKLQREITHKADKKQVKELLKNTLPKSEVLECIPKSLTIVEKTLKEQNREIDLIKMNIVRKQSHFRAQIYNTKLDSSLCSFHNGYEERKSFVLFEGLNEIFFISKQRSRLKV